MPVIFEHSGCRLFMATDILSES